MWMLAHLTYTVLTSATLSNQIFCSSFLVQNHVVVICVPTTSAKRFFFSNHTNKKVVGDKHNVLVHYVNICVPDLSGGVIWNPFKSDILWFVSDQKSCCCLCAVPSTTSKWILFRNHTDKKVVGGKHNVLIHYTDASEPNSSGVVLCNTFKWDILLCVPIHFKSLKCVFCVWACIVRYQ